MTFSYSDIAITAVIIAVVLYAAHRLGQNNPVGTGKLARRLSAVEAKVSEQGEKIDGVERTLVQLAEGTAGTKDDVAGMRADFARYRELAERTWDAVDRLQNYFIEEAFAKRRSGR